VAEDKSQKLVLASLQRGLPCQAALPAACVPDSDAGGMEAL